MSQLNVRKIDFQFPDDIPFHWNPANPSWSNFVNFITLIAPAFERYFIKATRQAMPLIGDARIRDDADKFCLQEAQHSKHHLSHLAMLIRKHPGLEETRQAIMASYDRLFAEQSLDFHLSYAATIELCFGPFASFLITHHETYFKGGDNRIASFLIWHLIEEFEHRNAAYDVYNAVVDSYFYRMKTAPAVIRHLTEISKISIDGLNRHAPVHADGTGPGDTRRLFDGVPKRAVLKLAYELGCTLLPYHKPDNLKEPAWVSQWFADDAAGHDMRLYYR
ncbi:MAG TPA: metal-dependent hydrolase [Pseudomonadales bacterium]